MPASDAPVSADLDQAQQQAFGDDLFFEGEIGIGELGPLGQGPLGASDGVVGVVSQPAALSSVPQLHQGVLEQGQRTWLADHVFQDSGHQSLFVG